MSILDCVRLLPQRATDRITIDTELQILEIDGLKISLDVLYCLADPDPQLLYRFKREGDNCVVTVVPVQDPAATAAGTDTGGRLG